MHDSDCPFVIFKTFLLKRTNKTWFFRYLLFAINKIFIFLVNLFTNTDVFYLFIKIMKAIYSNENRTFLDEFISSC